jgi:hypothetical protein
MLPRRLSAVAQSMRNDTALRALSNALNNSARSCYHYIVTIQLWASSLVG